MEIDTQDLEVQGHRTTQYLEEENELLKSDDEVVHDAQHRIHAAGIAPGIAGRAHSDAMHHHITKWKRLQQNYSDGYLELFKETENDHDLEGCASLLGTQLGVVIWTSAEKRKLFTALARYGRHDFPQMSNAVATKSSVEVKAYLDTVHEAFVDRQLFNESTKNVSIAEIPAAVEIGPECERVLEAAADALSAYQEQYDLAVQQNHQGLIWLIDQYAAVRLDAVSDDVEHEIVEGNFANDVHPGDATKLDKRGIELFKLAAMLDLSEKFFMNRIEGTGSLHWKSVAEPGQAPALTQDAVNIMFNLVVERLRYIIRICIQVAEARLSSGAGYHYSPSHKVRRSDIIAALDILSMPCDAWDYWTALPRRNGHQVVTGSHNKGESLEQVISYDDAEAALAPRRGRGRRRSMSIGSQVSSGDAMYDTSDPSSTESQESSPSLPEDVYFQERDAAEDDHDSYRLSDPSASSGSSTTDLSDIPDPPAALDGMDRRAYLEAELDDFAEAIDQKSKSEEEAKIWQILGKRPHSDIKEEEEKVPSLRPKVLRRTKEDLDGWSCRHISEWESFGGDTNVDAPAMNPTTLAQHVEQLGKEEAG